MSGPRRSISDSALRQLGNGITYAVLMAGALLFAIPFLSMVSTSVKLDEELGAEQTALLPAAPIARYASPYTMEESGITLDRPADMDRDTWRSFRPMLENAVAARIGRWWDRQTQIRSSFAIVDRNVAERMLTPVVATDVLNQISDRARAQGVSAMSAELPSLIDDKTISDEFDQYICRFCLGEVRIRRSDYTTIVAAGPEEWTISEGDGRLSDLAPPFVDAGQAARLMSWNARPGAKVAATIVPRSIDLASGPRVDRIYVTYRADQSWGNIDLSVICDGRLYVQDEALYSAQRTWGEVELRLPGREPEPFSGRTYLRLRDAGPAAPHAPAFAVTLSLRPNSTVGAWWAKASRNYRSAFRQVPMIRYIATSVSLAILSILLTVFGSSLSAYAFARIQFPGRGVMFALLLATMMIPAQVTMIPAFMINKSLGWFDTLYPLWVPSIFGSAFFIFMLRQFFLAVPRELEEAARIDGCGFLRIYWHVMLPLVRPTLVTVTIFAFMASWNSFMLPLIYVNDERLYNLAFGLFKFKSDAGTNDSLIMAGSFVMTVPIIAMFFFFQRYFVQGISLSGLGGR